MDKGKGYSKGKTGDYGGKGYGGDGGYGAGGVGRDGKEPWVPGRGRNPDLEDDRRGFGRTGNRWSDHDDRMGGGDRDEPPRAVQRRGASPGSSWRHDKFEEVTKEAKEAKEQKEKDRIERAEEARKEAGERDFRRRRRGDDEKDDEGEKRERSRRPDRDEKRNRD